MSTKAEAILEQFETLPPAEQQELWRELRRRIAPVELHSEPLTDEDIADSAPAPASPSPCSMRRNSVPRRNEVWLVDFLLVPPQT